MVFSSRVGVGRARGPLFTPGQSGFSQPVQSLSCPFAAFSRYW